MEIITVYVKAVPNTAVLVYKLAISDWYCKPAILESLACKLSAKFICCSKYGSRQFMPKYHYLFPVHCCTLLDYKKGLPYIVLEFNNCGTREPFGKLYEKCLRDFVVYE